MSNENNITVSKNLWLLICFSLFILLCILLYLLLSNPSKNGDSQPTELKEAIGRGNFFIAPLMDKNGRVDIFSEKGDRIEPCGSRKGTKVDFDDCGDIKGDLIFYNNFNVRIIKENPECIEAHDSNGNVWFFHRDGRQC